MNRFVIFVAIVAALFAVGCQRKPAAVVNGVEVSQEELKWHLNVRLADHRARGADVRESAVKSAVLDKIIADKLLLELALNNNITLSDAELTAEMDMIKQRVGEDALNERLTESGLTMDGYRNIVRETILVQKFIATLVSPDDITDEDVKRYYQESTTPMLKPEKVQVRFIQLAEKSQADSIVKELDGGAQSFDAVADRIEAEGAATVSEYSWTTPDFFSPAISEGLKSIEVGGFGGPFESKDGYFIFRVKERQHETAKSFEEARDEIKAMLFDRRVQSSVAHLISQKKKTARIIIN